MKDSIYVASCYVILCLLASYSVVTVASAKVQGGGKAILLQNSKQLLNSDSSVKVEGKESFSNIFARILGGSVEGIEKKPSSVSGNIFYRPEANVVLVLEDEKQNILSNDDFQKMFFVKKNIVDEHVNTWCKLAGAMTEMSDNQKTIALTASYDDQYAVSANTAHKDSKSVRKTFTANGEEAIQLPSLTSTNNNFNKYGYSEIINHLKTNPHGVFNGLKMKVEGNQFVFKGGMKVGYDDKFLIEIGIFSLLISDIKKNKIDTVEGTHSIIMVMSEMNAFLSKYSHNMAEYKVARSIVRTVSKALIVAYDELFPNRLTAEVIVVKKLSHRNSEALMQRGRRLDEKIVGNSTAGTGYTNAQIEDYQVYLWSFLLLGFILYLSIYSLMFMDINEDPQLFANYLLTRPKQD
eukprot:g3401.t1